MDSLGICIGASTISLVELRRDGDGGIVKRRALIEPHHGNPRATLQAVLGGLTPERCPKIAVTGRRFRHLVNLSSISEPEAVETALLHLNGNAGGLNALVSAGAETFLVYVIGKNGRITNVQTGNKCASGTGEFLIQQIRRLGMSVEEAARVAVTEEAYRVSGRCSVFCKSDCTHASNKGVPKGRIVAGLCKMMAGKILEIMKQIPRENVMVVGGTTRNRVFVEHLAREISGLVVPEEAAYFEAFGGALWALENETLPYPGTDKLFKDEASSFAFLPLICSASGMVEFRTRERGIPQEGDRCILGLDVGSTTTKAVLLRTEDDRILGSVYLRTNGDPVGASRECYDRLCCQLGDLQDKVRIAGLGVTGSGRYIAGLHAMTDGIVNEIAAHATAALHFDPEVDTIFEIGGQDAKYTFITNRVPSDYAMNEACSAGTGSFLEESAKETLGIATEEIGDIALSGRRPPNFNDQCAAFISSDIKRAFHEGIDRADVVAGLVYSICMNYHKRVKGSRPVGKKVFMQGGVCYNRAVPVAMASLIGRRITVPPDPGLMGAFGVALEIKRRLELRQMTEQDFSLGELASRQLEYGKPFVCNGGKEACDRKCEIARIRINGKTFPFGGACNRWYNLRQKRAIRTEDLDVVARYEKTLFGEGQGNGSRAAESIGINKSFFANSFYPLYHSFFTGLGLRVVLARNSDQEGIDRKAAPFCFPAEIAHGFLSNLLRDEVDYLFLPHFKGQPGKGTSQRNVTCPISQAEPYYLRSAFRDHDGFRRLMESGRILSPIIDFSRGFEAAEHGFIQMASVLGRSRSAARRAYAHAVGVQKSAEARIREEGLGALRQLEKDPDSFAVVIFGRPYNAFVSESHLGIPHKFASRGIRTLPVTTLPADGEHLDDGMYWAAGQTILRGAQFVARHPQLFGCYITNFSCGPDSFLITRFRDVMGRKPSLTLELDSHTADAGLETRIEAFIDIVKSHVDLSKKRKTLAAVSEAPRECRLDIERGLVVDSQGLERPLRDPRIHVLFPGVGGLPMEATAATFRGAGVRATALPPADEQALELGKSHSLCKECLPLLLTTGSLLKHIKETPPSEDILLYFMPRTSGPCRFGQYAVFVSDLIRKLGIRNLAVYSPTDDNGYAGFGDRDLVAKTWSALVIADIMQDIHSVLITNAEDRDSALGIFRREWQRVLETLECDANQQELENILRTTAATLRSIPVKRGVDDTPLILLTGEIYVRHDHLSRQDLVERLADHGFAAKVASVLEWIYYVDWCRKHGLTAVPLSLRERVSLFLKSGFMRNRERRLREIMARSGLLPLGAVDVDHLIQHTRHLIDPALTGEAILTVGAALNEVPERYCGAIAIGPFGCMPNRISEAILSREMNRQGKLAAGNGRRDVERLLERIDNLPFLAIESDGGPFPQIITARLEAFLLQARRVHEELRAPRA